MVSSCSRRVVVCALWLVMALKVGQGQNTTAGNGTQATEMDGSAKNETVAPTEQNVTTSQNVTQSPGNASNNIFDHGMDGLIDDDSGQTPTTNETIIDTSTIDTSTNDTSIDPSKEDDGGNTTQYQIFRTSGELVDAVGQWMDNDTETVTEKYGNISDWDVSYVDYMAGLFQGHKTFNADISKWSVGNVTDMTRIFLDATSFNADLSKWDTRKVTAMTSAFQGAASFAADISAWNTTKVKSMTDMFRGASAFNADISFWQTGQLKDMSTMFWEATSFNIDLTPWDVFHVGDFGGAFLNATSFSQQLCWKMKEETLVTRMFCGTNGASIRSDCICEIDLYYDKECVNPSRVQETTCNPPSLQVSTAVSRSSFTMVAMLSILSMVVWQ